MTPQYLHNAYEEIDAAMFSGDNYVDLTQRKELRHLMARWERELKRFDTTFPNGSLDGEASEILEEVQAIKTAAEELTAEASAFEAWFNTSGLTDVTTACAAWKASRAAAQSA